MRQRVALARALAATSTGGADTGLLLMDEPFAALDAITRDFLQGELARIWQATGTAVLFVTHDVREAVRLGQRVVLLLLEEPFSEIDEITRDFLQGELQRIWIF